MTTDTWKSRLAAAGLSLPPTPAPVASYVPAVRVGDLVFTSGQVAFDEGVVRWPGVLGAGLEVADGRRAARLCALNALAAAEAVTGPGEQLTRVVKVVGFVASARGFSDQPVVVEGASALLVELFTDGHARSAVGVAALPLGASVEIELIAQVGPVS